MTAAPAIIAFRNISKSFGPLRVLRDICLEVAQGERIVICGPSGSGKSTLINCVNGLEDKDLLLRSAQRFDLDGTATPVAGILRGVWNSSTDWSQITRNWHFACERVLNEAGTPARLRASTTNAYWHGRLVRLYLLSVYWNAAAGRPLILLNRLLHAADATLRAGPRLFSSGFWRALTRQHLTAGFDPAGAAPRQQPYPQPTRQAG